MQIFTKLQRHLASGIAIAAAIAYLASPAGLHAQSYSSEECGCACWDIDPWTLGGLVVLGGAVGATTGKLAAQTKGKHGHRGDPGPDTDLGPTGPTGPQGPVGPRGPTGFPGIRGPGGGPQGDEGARGPTGPQGFQGDIGPEGPSGPTGPAGLITTAEGGASLTFTFNSITESPAPTGTWQGIVVDPNNNVYTTPTLALGTGSEVITPSPRYEGTYHLILQLLTLTTLSDSTSIGNVEVTLDSNTAVKFQPSLTTNIPGWQFKFDYTYTGSSDP